MFNILGTVWGVKVVQCREFPLDIHTCSELSGRADNDFYFGIIHLFKHGKALFIIRGIMHESNFIFCEFDIVNIALHISLKNFEQQCNGINIHAA